MSAPGLRPALGALDRRLSRTMAIVGHPVHRWSLGLLFIWFGLLKVFGFKSATTLIAHTVYLGSPQAAVPILGAWEAAIGLSLLWRPLVRVGLLLLLVRLPGTALALAVNPEVCFDGSIFVPTIEGQYLIKDLLLFGAALVIGGDVVAHPHAKPHQHS